MIYLISNENGSIFCYNPDDWYNLRKQWRILGELVGNTFFIPTLPLKLSPEEVLLLLDKNVVEIVSVQTTISRDNKGIYANFEKEQLANQKIIHKEKRRKQLLLMLDDIVEAKRKSGDVRTSDEILNDELEKSCIVSMDNLIWPILLLPLDFKTKSVPVPRNIIENQTTEVRNLVYKDLWEHGYYLTSGHKFGGDFLVYLGDPINYHAILVVRCLSNMKQKLNSSEIVAFGRLCNSVKKRAILATIQNDSIVSYLTISWIDS